MKEDLSKTPTLTTDAPAELSPTDRKRLSRWRFTLFFSFIAGILSAFSGLLLGAISYTGFARHAKAFNQTGNLLIIAAFPLMMLGAHALDKINELKSHGKRR